MDNPERISIPLVMLPGNLECLLENDINVESISLEHHENNGVILTVRMNPVQKAEAKRLGFRTKRISDG